MKKKVLTWSLVLTLIIACFPPLSVQAADDPSTYQIYYTFSDIQAEKGSADLRYGTNTNHISWQQLSTNDASRGVNANGIFYLARNEREGIQIFYYGTAEATRKKLSVTVSEFTNDDGVKLAHSVFKERYVTPLGLTFGNNALRLADPLVPYDGASVDLTAGENEMFYIEVRSKTDQPAGVYYANVTFADEDGVFRTNKIAAVVWDFALPQQHHASMILGLHNAASGYRTTSGFLRQNGVNFDQNGNILEEDKEKAYRIIAGWNEYLLDHGISPYEITYNLVDDDPKAAELAMADIRQKSFFVPLLSINSYNESYTSATIERINQYKQAIGTNQSLLSKAVFYVRDEVYLKTEEAKNILLNRLAAAGNAWPQVKRLVTYNGSDGTPQTVIDLMDTTKDIICVNTETLANTVIHDAYLNTFANKWRYYPGDNWHGTFELWLYGKSSVGQFRRKVFWEQHYNRENMLLYWNGAYYHKEFNVWENMELPISEGMQTGNGNGVLLYPGLAIGQDPETPIGSLRIKQIASGIDDADYLALAEEFLPAEEVPAWTSFFPEWEVMTMNWARIVLGNRLEQAAKDSQFTHSFSEWECLVEADSTHHGLETRTCTACGTVESRETEATHVPNPNRKLVSLAIVGDATVTTATSTYTCVATYDDNSTDEVQPVWTLSAYTYAGIDKTGGVLTNKNTGTVTRQVYVKAKYTEKGVTIDTSRLVKLQKPADGPAPETPSVTVAATDATAGEPGLADGTGTFTFTRTGAATAALTVNFTVSGTATAGADYASIGTSVTFAAGQATVTKTVTALADELAEGGETVTVTLATGTGYTLGSSKTATVTIKDVQSADPEPNPNRKLVSLAIVGDATVTTATSTYTCVATYDDNSTDEVQPVWTLSAYTYAGIDKTGGVLTNKNTGTVTRQVYVKAKYTEKGVTIDTSRLVKLQKPADGPAPETPSVTVAATDATAGEPGLADGTGTFTRTRAETAALTEKFTGGDMASDGTLDVTRDVAIYCSADGSVIYADVNFALAADAPVIELTITDEIPQGWSFVAGSVDGITGGAKTVQIMLENSDGVPSAFFYTLQADAATVATKSLLTSSNNPDENYYRLASNGFANLTLPELAIVANADFAYEEWSENAELYSPADGRLFRATDGVDAAFSWPLIEGAAGYRLVVATYDGEIVYDGLVDHAACTVRGLTAGSYAWNVTALGSEAGASATFHFAVTDDGGLPFILEAKADGDAIVLTIGEDAKAIDCDVFFYSLESGVWTNLKQLLQPVDRKTSIDLGVKASNGYLYIRPQDAENFVVLYIK